MARHPKYNLILILLFVVAGIACHNDRARQQEKPLARVFDKYLYAADLVGSIPTNIPPADSILLANDFIDKWVRKQLLLKRAELNLTEEEKDVSGQIENYRTSLLIFKYEQNYISDKLDTLVKHSEIESYYQDNLANFILNNHLVKAVFLQVPRNAPDIWNARRWMSSDDAADLTKLEAYAVSNARRYEYFNDDLVDLREVEKLMPLPIDRPERSLKYRKVFDQMDSTYHFLLYVKDFRVIGDYAPLKFVEANIRTIIMNKRRIQLVNMLETNSYNDAFNRGYFTIY